MGAVEYKKVGEILVHHRKISKQGLKHALSEGKQSKEPLLSVLRRRGSINVFDAAFALLEQSCAKLDENCHIARTFSEQLSYA